MGNLAFVVPPAAPGQPAWYYGLYAAGLSFMIITASTYPLIWELKYMKFWYFLGCSIGLILGTITTYITINITASIITCITLIIWMVFMYKKFNS